MKIELNNIGPFVEASVDIDGITVVAGENGTGKSTIGKTLYAMFDAFYLYDDLSNQVQHSYKYSSNNS